MITPPRGRLVPATPIERAAPRLRGTRERYAAPARLAPEATSRARRFADGHASVGPGRSLAFPAAPKGPVTGRPADSFRSGGGWGRLLAERIRGTNAHVDPLRPGPAGVRKPPRERMPGSARVGSTADPGPGPWC